VLAVLLSLLFLLLPTASITLATGRVISISRCNRNITSSNIEGTLAIAEMLAAVGAPETVELQTTLPPGGLKFCLLKNHPYVEKLGNTIF